MSHQSDQTSSGDPVTEGVVGGIATVSSATALAQLDLLASNAPYRRINVAVGRESMNQVSGDVLRFRAFRTSGEVSNHSSVRMLKGNAAAVMKTGIAAVSFVLDGVNLALAIEQDGGTFGKNSTASLTSTVINAMSAPAISAALASLNVSIGILAPTVIGAFIAALLSAGVNAAIVFGWRGSTDHMPAHVPSVNFDDIHPLFLCETDVAFVASDSVTTERDVVRHIDPNNMNDPIFAGMGQAVKGERDVMFGAGYKGAQNGRATRM